MKQYFGVLIVRRTGEQVDNLIHGNFTLYIRPDREDAVRTATRLKKDYHLDSIPVCVESLDENKEIL